MPDAPEERLRRFVRGDAAAFEDLFRQFEADVQRWVTRILRDANAADDVLVETFWRAYRARARFDPARSFGAWLRRIATNAALDYLRVIRRQARREFSPELEPRAPVDQSAREVRESVAIAFRKLPARFQLVATLALIEGQSYAEIAAALDVPIGTVKSRVFRAQRLLRAELARLGIQP